MAEEIRMQIDKIRASINGLEAQRDVLGDAVLEPALETLRQQLALLEELAAKETAPAEERRMVTILFMDMVGSTSLAEKLDPEEWRQVVSRFHTALGEAITAHHGSVAQYLGDGILAFFGSKQASEEDPENAIRAALEGQAAVASAFPLEKVKLRAGIHTGLVVVGDLGEASHKEFTASGDAMNLAARLQSAAPPGGILISYDTYRYVRGVFDLIPRPPLTVKGKSEPLQTYLVRGAKPRPFRSVSRGVAGIEIRTVGREGEIQSLQAAYLRAYEGHGVVWAQLVGDPGVGKSRLVVDMNDWMELREETYRLLRARAFADDLHQPFALVRRLWFDRFQIAEDAPLDQAEAKWVERFKEFSGNEECEEAANALGLLVGLTFANSPYIRGMRNDPAQLKGRALVVSRELVKAVRNQYPMVVLLEDLQWVDSPSWEYLTEVFLDDADPEQPNGLFILGAARPEWHPPVKLSGLFKVSQPEDKHPGKWGVLISLAPLSDTATHELAEELLQRVEDIPENIIELIVERSEGVPYYSEEMVNWLIDHGILDTSSERWRFLPERLKEEPLPATLQHLLLTRLSSLSQSERAVLQRGAIFGRRFWTGGVTALGVPSGAETLGHLQPRGFVEAQRESAFQGDTEWSFRQNLLQEVTYESVLKRERAELHKVAADWLEKQASRAGRLDEFAGLLGEHYERAGELGIAADWYMKAGWRAFALGASNEARGFYTQALDLLPPVDRERRWQALLGREEALQMLSEIEPWKEDIKALMDLALTFGDENHLAEGFYRKSVLNTRIAEDKTGFDQACAEALRNARLCGNEAIEAKTLSLLGSVGVDMGEKDTSIKNIEQALVLAHHLGDDNILSIVLRRAATCYAEVPDVARSISLLNESIELSRRMGDRGSESIGLGNLASSYIWLGLYKQARTILEQAVKINETLGLHRQKAYNLLNMGLVHTATSDLRKARHFFELAQQELLSGQDQFGKAVVATGIGRIQIMMGDSPGATRSYRETYDLASKVGLKALICEGAAGLALSALGQGQMEDASRYVREAWNYLKEFGSLGMDNPGYVYRTCAEIFDALGEEENTRAVLENGYQTLMEAAETINVPEWRKSFLEENTHNRAFLELWERRCKQK